MHISSGIFYLIAFALWVSYLIAVSEEKKLFSETFILNLERFRKLSLPSKYAVILIGTSFCLLGGAKQDNPLWGTLDSLVSSLTPSQTESGGAQTESQEDPFVITSFSCGTNAFQFSAEWTSAVSLTNDALDVFGVTNLLTARWEYLGAISVTPESGAADFDILYSSLTNGWEGSGFFRIATQEDSDGDGLSDAYERLVSLTDGRLSDSEGDGLSDFMELFTYGTDALLRDTDTDGYDDDEEIIAGTNPKQATEGANGTIRYYYDADDRLLGGYSGNGAVKLEVTPAGNAVTLHERGAP